MLKSSKDVAKQLGVHRTSVNRIIRENPDKFDQVVKTGKRNALLITEEGIELLKEYFQPKHESEHNPITTESNQSEAEQSRLKHELEMLRTQLNHAQENAHNNLSKAEQEKEYFRKKLEKEEDERRALQWTMTEMQQRHDTIVMSLTKRLEDIQQRLPALPDPNAKRPGVVKRFLSWLTEPDQKPTNWEEKDQRFA